MARWQNNIGEVVIKVVITGQPESGKASILRHLAQSHGQSAVKTGGVSEAHILRTEYICAEPLPDGPFVRVKVFALSGHPFHQAAERLLLEGADAIVFVADCDPKHIIESRDYLLSMMDNASHANVDLNEIAIAVQYSRVDRNPDFRPAELDAWLGIEAGRVARYMSSATTPDTLSQAVDAVVDKVQRQLLAEMNPPSGQEEAPLSDA